MKRRLGWSTLVVGMLLAGLWWGSRRRTVDETSHSPTAAAPVGVANAEALTRQAPPDESALMAMVDRDPLAAIQLASTHLQGVAFDRVQAAALDVLLEENPADAAAIIASLPAGDFQRVVAGRAARLWAALDPAAALGWAQGLDEEAARLRATREVLGSWAQSDPVAASRALGSMPSERENALSALAVMSAWIQTDPAAAVAWGATLPSAAMRNLVMTSAVHGWGAIDANAALHWLDSQPAGVQAEIDAPTRFAVLRELAKQDPTAAQAYVHALPATESKARAAAAISPVLAHADPESAMEWALTLENRSWVLAAFRDAFRRLQEIDPDEALRVLAQSDLSPEDRDRLAVFPQG